MSEIQHPTRTAFRFTYRGEIRTLPIEQITHLTTDDRYIAAHSAQGTHLLSSKERVAKLADEFPNYFIRIRRDTLVARRLLKAAVLGRAPDAEGGNSYRLTAQGIEPLPVARRYLPIVRSALAEVSHEQF